jgi:hypothetical protein
MIYVKATTIGVVSGLLLAALWLFAALWLPVYVQMVLATMRNEGGFAGASVVGSGSIMLAALIGFVAGFWWTLHRARRRQFSH